MAAGKTNKESTNMMFLAEIAFSGVLKVTD